MKDKYVVHTPNPDMHVQRFGNWYFGSEDNFDRLTICGIPNESDKTVSVGVAFCCYPDNFSRVIGILMAESSVEGYPDRKPYAIIPLEEYTQEAVLKVLYDIHADLVSRSVRGVKKLLSNQIVK